MKNGESSQQEVHDYLTSTIYSDHPAETPPAFLEQPILILCYKLTGSVPVQNICCYISRSSELIIIYAMEPTRDEL